MQAVGVRMRRLEREVLQCLQYVHFYLFKPQRNPLFFFLQELFFCLLKKWMNFHRQLPAFMKPRSTGTVGAFWAGSVGGSNSKAEVSCLTVALLQMLSVWFVLYPPDEQHSPMLPKQPLQKWLCVGLTIAWSEIQANSRPVQNTSSHNYQPNCPRCI